MSDNSQRLPVTFPGKVYGSLRKAAFEQHVSMAAIVVRAVRKELGMETAEEETSNG